MFSWTISTPFLTYSASIIRANVLGWMQIGMRWDEWGMNWRDAPLHRVDFHLPSANVAGGLGAQYEYFSAQVEVKAFDATRANWIESLNLEIEKFRKDLYRFYSEHVRNVSPARRKACLFEWKLGDYSYTTWHTVSNVPPPRIAPDLWK